jgi:hypothetical protein
MHEVPPILELAQGENAELEAVIHDVVGNLCPSRILRVVWEAVRAAIRGIEMTSRQRVQGLDRMIADSNIDKILLNVRANTGYFWIVVLFVEHRATVATDTPCPAVDRRREEESCAALLRRRQRLVIPD